MREREREQVKEGRGERKRNEDLRGKMMDCLTSGKFGIHVLLVLVFFEEMTLPLYFFKRAKEKGGLCALHFSHSLVKVS